MAFSRLSDDELLGSAEEVFRQFGYEAATLSRLAGAARMEKASLYYRFPGGKTEIALAVAARVLAWFQASVFTPLAQPAPPARRIAVVVRALRDFYGEGTRPCLIDTLSLGGGTEELNAALRFALQSWLAAFTQVARDAGLPSALAARRAEQAVSSIEGSLVLSRVLGGNSPFQHAMAGLAKVLTEP